MRRIKLNNQFRNNMSTRHILLFVALIKLAHSNTDQLDILTDFIKNDIVQDLDLLSAPSEFVNVSYSSGKSVHLGNVLTPTEVKDQPTLSFAAKKGIYYTVLLVS